MVRNLRCVSPTLRAKIERADASLSSGAEFCTTKARSGHVVTGAVVDGRKRFFHSTYDPLKEADRLASAAATQTLIVMGFGTGYHLAPLLRRVTHLIVVEPDLQSVIHALQCVDLTETLSHPNLQLIVGEATQELRQHIAEVYLPVIHGSASVIGLPGRTQAARELFTAVQEDLRAGLELVAQDFAVQARFGRLWMRNTIANLAALTSGTHGTAREGPPAFEYPDLARRRVVVTAAGPSLNLALGALSSQSGAVILATDTSLPTLTEAGITPAAVLTVDCQPASYLHYLTARFPRTLLLADLAAPPSVFRQYRRVGPLLSRHPFHSLLRAVGGRLVGFDSSGGNVTHAAVSLAVSLGAASIDVVGADFSYPQGQSYARSSYIHTHFAVRALRTRPESDGLYHFVRNRPGLYRDEQSPSTLRQPALDRYAAALADLAATAAIPVTMGSINITRPAGASVTAQHRAPGSQPDIALPRDILNRLHSLFVSADDLGEALSGWTREATGNETSINPTTRAVTAALLPFVAWYRRGNPETPVQTLLQTARHEAIDLLSQFAEI